MLRLILMILFFLLSLLTVFRAPTNFLWYISILVTEFSWIFFGVVVVLLLWRFGGGRYSIISSVIGVAALVLFALPVIQAYRLAEKLFSNEINTSPAKLATSSPFSFRRVITGINSKQISYKTFTYDAANGLTLDFYPAPTQGKKPCVIVVHGGSWAGGDSRQLPGLN
ncbi:MAG: alpha/beta hydrolase, partial [Segetibacter sp.]|nr:alpha/beta hydrolase [Segetibacter sp.]